MPLDKSHPMLSSSKICVLKREEQGPTLWRNYFSQSGSILSFNTISLQSSRTLVLPPSSASLGTTRLRKSSLIWGLEWIYYLTKFIYNSVWGNWSLHQLSRSWLIDPPRNHRESSRMLSFESTISIFPSTSSFLILNWWLIPPRWSL